MNKLNTGIIATVVVGSIIIIVGIVLGWYVFPNMIEDQITENVELKEGTEQYDRFKVLPIPIEFKVYFFNISNINEVRDGATPVMQEVGPFIYTQTRKKMDITRDDKSNTISYYEHMNFEFSNESPYPADQEVIILNLALNSAIQILEDMLPMTLPLFTENVTKIAFKNVDVFMTTQVNEFLFDGYTICDLESINKTENIEDRSGSALICLGLYIIPTRNLRIENDSVVFTFLNHKNITHDGHYTVNNGMSDINKVGLIEKWEDEEYLKFWTGENSTCNKVRGRDTVIYPPFLKKDSVLTILNTDICRTVDIYYRKEKEIRDVTALEYILKEDTLNAPDDELGTGCYCLNVSKGINYENGCLKKGVQDLFTCYNAPVVLSFPHFLWADDDYKNSVKGLDANEEKHITYVHLEPDTGTPLAGSKRVQFNMFLRSVPDVDYLKIFKNPRILPILWLDEHVDITDDLYDKLYDQYVVKMMLVTGVTWGIIALGIVMVVIPVGVAIWKNRSSKRTV